MQTSEQFVCVCRRTFSRSSALTKHKQTCKLSKKRLSSALAKAKQLWHGPKRRRLHSHNGHAEARRFDSEAVLEVDPISQAHAGMSEGASQAMAAEHAADHNPFDDSHLSLMERKPWKKRQNRVLPKRYRDLIPQPLLSLPPSVAPNSPTRDLIVSELSIDDDAAALQVPSSTLQSPVPHRTLTTERNGFGLFRRYYAKEEPEHDPEENITLDDLSDICTDTSPRMAPTFYPYPNRSSFLLGEWYWNGGLQKSQASFKDLTSIIIDPEFKASDIKHTRWNSINRTLGCMNELEWLDEDAGWMSTPVSINVPYQSRRGVTSDPGAGPREFTVPNFHHRNLISVIREKLAHPTDAAHFHYEPYELNWQPAGSTRVVRTYGELYTSPAFVEAHHELQSSPPEPDCGLPRFIVALMFASDVTHLTSFGDCKIWPLYMFFGNESKYRRSKPSSNACHHVAYFEKLPPAFKDFAAKQTAGGLPPSNAFMTFCARELIHAQWEILLDEEFLDAWKHGIIMPCHDRIRRRFYPRLFTYSADYPEKITLAGIRNLAQCPCPRCRIPLALAGNLGMRRDMALRENTARLDDTHRKGLVVAARRVIYQKHFAIDSSGQKISQPVPNPVVRERQVAGIGQN